MDYINLLAKDEFPVSTDTLNIMQEMTLLTTKLALLGGSNYILQGCIEDNEGKVSSGIIVIDGEISNWKYLLEHSCIIQLLFVYLYDNQIYVNYASDKINRSRKG